MIDIHSFIDGLPKAELHMHLEGCIEPEMMLSLASRNGLQLRWSSPEDLRRAYEFDSLQDFLNLYFEGCRVIETEQDFYDITKAYLARASSDNVLHAEMFIGPQSFTDRAIPVAALMDGVLSAMRDAETEHGVTSGLLISAHRHRTQEAAFELLEQIMPWADQIAGIGMGGAEIGNPPSKFIDFFRTCRDRGFRTSIHAGEEGPASYVREAIELLSVDRIDHGNAALDDEALVQLLVEREIPLTVCPLSNLKLKVVPTLDQHPLKRMLDLGLKATVNSDDPPYFGGYVNANFKETQTHLGLTRDQCVTLARNSVTSAFVSDAHKSRMLASVDAYVLAA